MKIAESFQRWTPSQTKIYLPFLQIFLKQQLVAVVFDKKYSDHSAGKNDVNEGK
jgi:hypothetical protein